jgi:hypothetical protein
MKTKLFQAFKSKKITRQELCQLLLIYRKKL